MMSGIERRRLWFAVLLSAAMFQWGCASAHTSYRASRGAPGELSLQYDDGFKLINGDKVVSRSPSYEGLPEFVACVPDAYRHASQARAEGSKGTTLKWLSIGFAVAGLGGLSGLAVQSQDPNLAIGLLVGGVVTEVLASPFKPANSRLWKAAHSTPKIVKVMA